MRFWNRKSDPNAATPRRRSATRRAGNIRDRAFGQRPMFTRPDDEDVTPAASEMPPESRLDDLTPTDRNTRNIEDQVRQLTTGTVVSFSTVIVSSPPTDAQITAAFGIQNQVPGFVGVIWSGGSSLVWLIGSTGSGWYYEQLTQAV